MMSMPTQRSMTRSGSALRAAAQKASSARMDGGGEESEGESILSSVALLKAAALPLVSFTPASTASSFIMSGSALRPSQPGALAASRMAALMAGMAPASEA